MNKPIPLRHLLCVVFALATSRCVGQMPEFAPVGAIWYFTNDEQTGQYGYITIESVADTIIQGHDCKKLEKKIYLCSGAIETEPPVYVYTTGDSVMYSCYPNGNFYVLYNFGAVSGDNWETSYTHGYPLPDADTTAVITVTSTCYTTSIGNDTLRCFQSESDNPNLDFDHPMVPNTIFERIGSQRYLVSTPFFIQV